MQLKSKADPINVLVIKQNPDNSGPASFAPQCQLPTHNNTLTSPYNTSPGAFQGETVSHLHKHSFSRTANSGMAIVSQSTETEVTSAIGGSIVTPAVAHEDNIKISDLPIDEMSQDDGKLIQ